MCDEADGGYDLFSVTLHEILHVLAFTSRIAEDGGPLDETGTPGVIEEFYSIWDKHVFDKNGAPVILPTTNPLCLDEHEFNTVTFPSITEILAADCDEFNPDLYFKELTGSTELARIGSSSIFGGTSVFNFLSHLEECESDGTSGQYVMHATKSSGEETRRLHPNEIDILTELGYTINDATNDDFCYVEANDDLYNLLVEVGEQLIIPIDFILSNDIYSSNDIDFSIVESPNCSFGWNVNYQAEVIGDNIIITGLAPNYSVDGCSISTANLCYDILCGGVSCDRGNIDIMVREVLPELPECILNDPCDNLICNGSFEEYIATSTPFYFQNSTEEYKLNFQAIPNNTNIAFTGSETGGDYNQYLFFHDPAHIANFKLIESIEPGETVRVKFLGASRFQLPANLKFFGSENPPCKLIDIPDCNSVGEDLCVLGDLVYELYCINDGVPINNSGLPGSFASILPCDSPDYPYSENYGSIFYYDEVGFSEFEFTWINNTGKSIKHILMTFYGSGQRIAIDDLSVERIIPEPDASISIDLHCPEAQFGSNATPGDTHEWDFGDQSSTSQEENPFHVYEENGDYTVTHTVTNDCGSSTETTVVTIDCLGSNLLCECPDGGTTIGAPSQITLLSENPDLQSGLTGCVTIAGEFVVDETLLNVNAAEIYLEPGAKITVGSTANPNSTLRIRGGSHLQGCPDMWEGITVLSGSTVYVGEQSIIEDADVAIYGQEKASISILESSILNRNRIGIESTSGLSGLTLDGAIFDCTLPLPPPFDWSDS